MSIRYTVRTVPTEDMNQEILKSLAEDYTPDYNLIKRNELVRTEDKRTLIRNMDDSISDFFSFTTDELHDYIETALNEHDFSDVIDMEALNASIQEIVTQKVQEAVDAIEIPIPEVDTDAIKQELYDYMNEQITEAVDAIVVQDGADGKSAYQYAVEGGYGGTEAQFAVQLNRLMGIVDVDEVGF